MDIAYTFTRQVDPCKMDSCMIGPVLLRTCSAPIGRTALRFRAMELEQLKSSRHRSPDCCNCESLLVAQNKICTVTVFSGESVRTAMKLSLRCKDCKLNYGYSVFGNIQEGYHFLQRRKTLCWGQRRSIHGKKSLPLPSFFSVSTLSWL